MTDTDPEKKKPKKERPPREVTQDLLRRQALRYLDRFAATTMKLRRHLLNKNAKAIEFHGQDPETVLAMIDQEIEKLEKAGILNDQLYASGKARSMARQGKSSLQIGVKLGSLGFDEDQSDYAMEQLREEEGYTDRKAAAKYIRKRRFGPFKPLETREERLQKELASLVRNGFDYAMAKALLLLDSPEEIDEIIYPSD
ncbi:MAG: recombination regulator RecX [Sneathiellales bacterium]|nr:recombination regulator RecX [Sneathiellales bacterium]